MFSLKMQHLPDSILKVMIHRKWGVKTKTFFNRFMFSCLMLSGIRKTNCTTEPFKLSSWANPVSVHFGSFTHKYLGLDVIADL